MTSLEFCSAHSPPGTCCRIGRPFSRDAIGEFQFLSSRFDATQGRSTGLQVNAITKSGTNVAAGLFSGYFRDDNFNAADFLAGTVLPYSNQQFSGTYGGPILRDRLHYFANYEYEREPGTQTFNTPYPSFNIQLTGTRRTDMAGLRIDYQLSPQTRLMMRGNVFDYRNPYEQQQTGQQIGGPALKSFLSRAAGLSLFWIGRVGTRDATNSLKAYSTTFVREVGLESSSGFEIGLELVAKARRLRLPVAELPTIWLERAQGTSNFKVLKWLPRYLRWYLFAYGPKLTVEELRARSRVDG